MNALGDGSSRTPRIIPGESTEAPTGISATSFSRTDDDGASAPASKDAPAR
jgi:hypothetical protein